MRNWLIGLAAVTGTALTAAPLPAAAQMFEPDEYSYYGPGYTPPPYAWWGPPRAYGGGAATASGGTQFRLPPPAPSYYGPPAYYGPPMSYYSPPVAAPRPAPETTARIRGPGQCPTFFYYSNGRCVDSRLK